MEHPQPATPIKTDNSTAVGFVYDNITQKKSKSWDMRFNWLRDKELQNLIKVYWESGLTNYADYFTKHHSLAHHLHIREQYVRDTIIQMEQQFTQKCNNCFQIQPETSPLVQGCLDPVGTWPPEMTSQMAQDNGTDIQNRWDLLLTGKWSEISNQWNDNRYS